MNAAELFVELRVRYVHLECRGERLRIEAPRGVLTAELREALAQNKAEIIVALQGAKESGWPPESLESERRFGCREARLYPFLKKRVFTPAGPGRLEQVFTERVGVILERDPSRLSYFAPSEIAPAPASPVLLLPLEVPN